MALTVNELKKQRLENQVATLLEQYQAVIDELEHETDPARKVVLEKKADKLLNQYDEKLTELEQVKKMSPRQPDRTGQNNSSKNQNRLHLQWEEHLPKIDFEKVTKLMPEIIKDLPQGAVAAFLLQDSYRMCGKFCLTRVIEHLAGLSAEPPRHIEVGFTQYDTPSEAEFLRRLGQYQEIPSNSDLNSLVTANIEKICSSLGNAGIVLIELKIMGNLEAYESFVAWFLYSFWEPLINKVTAERRYVKLIALIHAWNPVPKKALGNYRCTVKQFNRARLLDLPLEKWELAEITAWLVKYSGLAHPSSGKTLEQIEKAAEVIHGSSTWPNDVYSHIKEMLTPDQTEKE